MLRRWLELYQQRSGGYPKSIESRYCDDYYYRSYYTYYTYHDVYDGSQEKYADFPKFVNGELGVVLVKNDDLVEALYAFDHANSWIDTVLVAEQLLPLDDLIQYATTRPKDTKTAWFNGMTARRMVREGRVEDARAWFEHAKAERWDWPWEDYQRYAKWKRTAEDIRESNDERALAYYNMARMVSDGYVVYRLMGSEEQFWLSHFWDWLGNDALYQAVTARQDTVMYKRRHRTKLGSDYALLGADLAENTDLKVALLVLGGTIPWGSDPQLSDVFFKRLCKLRPHPVAEIVNANNWFPASMQQTMRNAPYQTLEEVVAFVRTLELD